MGLRNYSNTATNTTLTADITNSATSMLVASVAGFPSTFPYTLSVDDGTASIELVDVTARSGLTLTVTRGVDGTTGVPHVTGAVVKHVITARDVSEPNAFINGTGVVGTTLIADGAVTNAKLANSSITVNGSAVSLGGSVTVAANGETFNPFLLIGT